MNNPKLVAALQTVFYGAMFAVIPILISAIGVDGALYAFLPLWVTKYGLTGVIVWVLNWAENHQQEISGKALFGAIG